MIANNVGTAWITTFVQIWGHTYAALDHSKWCRSSGVLVGPMVLAGILSLQSGRHQMTSAINAWLEAVSLCISWGCTIRKSYFPHWIMRISSQLVKYRPLEPKITTTCCLIHRGLKCFHFEINTHPHVIYFNSLGCSCHSGQTWCCPCSHNIIT